MPETFAFEETFPCDMPRAYQERVEKFRRDELAQMLVSEIESGRPFSVRFVRREQPVYDNSVPPYGPGRKVFMALEVSPAQSMRLIYREPEPRAAVRYMPMPAQKPAATLWQRAREWYKNEMAEIREWKKS